VTGQEWLFPYSQPLDQALIPFEIAFLQIIEKPPPLPYQLQEAPTGMVILDMNLEVPGEVVDTLTQQGYLHFGRASIRLMNPELLDDCLPVRLSNSHLFSALSLSFFLFVAQIFTIPRRPCKGALKKQMMLAADRHGASMRPGASLSHANRRWKISFRFRW
jgi:hypothetical protein